MVTVVGFVSLLVAGFGALAGGLVYLAVRISRAASGQSGAEPAVKRPANRDTRGRW